MGRNRIEQFSQMLADDLRNGCFARARHLPSIRKLSGIYHFSRDTVAAGLRGFCASGILERHGDLFFIGSAEAVAEPVAGNPPGGKGVQVAVIFPREDSFSNGIFEGISDCAAEHGVRLELFFNPGIPASMSPEGMIKSGIDGLLLLPNSHLRHYLSLFKARNVPVVQIDFSEDDVAHSLVEVDNFGGAFRAANTLIGRYRRMVHCFGFGTDAASGIRYDGYCAAMAGAGMADRIAEGTHFYPYIDLLGHFERRFENGASAHLGALKSPCSIFALNDYAAYSVYVAAQDFGLRIGEDVKIISFDDTPLAYSLNPPLSSVRQRRQAIGQEALRLLLRHIADPAMAPRRLTLPVQLIEKASS